VYVKIISDADYAQSSSATKASMSATLAYDSASVGLSSVKLSIDTGTATASIDDHIGRLSSQPTSIHAMIMVYYLPLSSKTILTFCVLKTESHKLEMA
jgi:hypothetical protein